MLSHDDTVGAMVRILDGLKSIAVNLNRAAENVAQQLEQQGQQATREEIMVNIILPHFLKSFTTMQAGVLEVYCLAFIHPFVLNINYIYPCVYDAQDYDVDEEELEQCVQYYLEHSAVESSKLREVVTKVRSLCAKFTCEDLPAADGPAAPTKTMDIGVLFEVLGAFGAKTKDYFGRLAEETVSQHGVPSTQEEILRFSEELNLVSDRAQDEVLSVFGYEKEEFEASIMRNQQSAELMQVLQQLQVSLFECSFFFFNAVFLNFNIISNRLITITP